ncbi:MAG TPA: hypothetical protein VNF73_08895 [Candidatus Saccharimonadales bacterium]|nr:hypothetical protein [Candidatus Saccharimonadales bacterium]
MTRERVDAEQAAVLAEHRCELGAATPFPGVTGELLGEGDHGVGRPAQTPTVGEDSVAESSPPGVIRAIVGDTMLIH